MSGAEAREVSRTDHSAMVSRGGHCLRAMIGRDGSGLAWKFHGALDVTPDFAPGPTTEARAGSEVARFLTERGEVILVAENAHAAH